MCLLEKVLRRAGSSRRKLLRLLLLLLLILEPNHGGSGGVTAHAPNPRAHRQRWVGLCELQASQGCTNHSLTDHIANKKE